MNAKTDSFATKYFQLSRLLVLIVLTTSGCGQLYRVTPLPKATDEVAPATTIGTVGVVATALDGDRSLEHFDGNLPMAGVLAVEVRLKNSGPAWPLSALDYSLRDTSHLRAAPLRAEQALRRVMKFYGNRLYQVEGYRETLAGYRRMELPRTGEIGRGEEINGILYFQIPRQARLAEGYQLVIRLGAETRSISLGPPGPAGPQSR